ncbi:MAG TPA: hypothetical protein V6C69_21670 [Trichormus sp.]
MTSPEAELNTPVQSVANEKHESLISQAWGWAKEHPGLAIGGAVATVATIGGGALLIGNLRELSAAGAKAVSEPIAEPGAAATRIFGGANELSANATPATGYVVRADGQTFRVLGGESAEINGGKLGPTSVDWTSELGLKTTPIRVGTIDGSAAASTEADTENILNARIATRNEPINRFKLDPVTGELKILKPDGTEIPVVEKASDSVIPPSISWGKPSA